jgi:hypothetical protein
MGRDSSFWVHPGWAAGWGGHIFETFLVTRLVDRLYIFFFFFSSSSYTYIHLWHGGIASLGGMMRRWNWPVCPGFRF